MLESSPLEIRFFSHSSPDIAGLGSHILRLTRFQNSQPPDLDHYRAAELRANLFVPPLGAYDTEVWITPSQIANSEAIQTGDPRIKLFMTTTDLYTYLRFVGYEGETHLPEYPTGSENSSGLCDLALAIYTKLFELIKGGTVPQNLVRMWNFIPNILLHEVGLKESDSLNSERYRQFNAGRQTAWRLYSGLNQHGKRLQPPAATGIGSAGGPLVIEALLTAGDIVDIENPRQTSSYHYSPKYGSLPPLFSRATVHLLDRSSGLLFISGTASVVGENTQHENDVIAQTHESFANLKVLISYDNLNRILPFKPKALDLDDLRGVRVHVKNTTHLELVRQVVESYLGQKPVCYVQDDICRNDLLVEIEANGIPV